MYYIFKVTLTTLRKIHDIHILTICDEDYSLAVFAPQHKNEITKVKALMHLIEFSNRKNIEICIENFPFVHYLYPLIPYRVLGSGANPSRHWKVISSSRRDKQPFTLIFTPPGNLA